MFEEFEQVGGSGTPFTDDLFAVVLQIKPPGQAKGIRITGIADLITIQPELVRATVWK